MNCTNGSRRRRRSRQRREEPTWRELLDAMVGRNRLRAAKTVKVISAPLISGNNNNSDCDSPSPATASPGLAGDIMGAPLLARKNVAWLETVRSRKRESV